MKFLILMKLFLIFSIAVTTIKSSFLSSKNCFSGSDEWRFNEHRRRVERMCTRLHLSVIRGEFRRGCGTEKAIIRGEIDIDVADHKGRTPLHFSALKGHIRIAELLLKHGADITKVDEYGRNVLHLSVIAYQPSVIVVNYFLDLGVAIDGVANGGSSALHFSAFNPSSRSFEIAKLLVERGANINLADHYMRTALHESVVHNKLEIAELLLERGAEINAADHKGQTALHLSALFGHLELAKLLVKYGANFDLVDNQGKTALELSEQLSKQISYQADVHEKFFEFWCEYKAIRHGADISLAIGHGCTALHLSVQKGHLEITKYLLDNGADIDEVDFFKRTALHFSVDFGYLEMTSLLLDRGADFKALDNQGKTALDLSISRGHSKIKELLLLRGGDEVISEAGDQECSICLENLGSDDRVTRELPCKHSFHKVCIDEWIERDETCPYCRISISEKTVDSESDEDSAAEEN